MSPLIVEVAFLKFNTRLLPDPNFMGLTTSLINQHKLKTTAFPSHGYWRLDLKKALIREACIDFSVHQPRQNNITILSYN